MGRTSQDLLVQPPYPSSESLLSSPRHPSSVLTSQQNHLFNLLAKCSFSHFQLFLLHLVLLKSPSSNQLCLGSSFPKRHPASPCCHNNYIFPFRAKHDANRLQQPSSSAVSVLVMLLLMEIHNADLSLNNVIKEKTTSDPATTSGTQVVCLPICHFFPSPFPHSQSNSSFSKNLGRRCLSESDFNSYKGKRKRNLKKTG